MPELPEVETLCRQLRKKICGRPILASEVYDEKLAGIKNTKGRNVSAVERRGKTINVFLNNGNLISIHLRMTGRLLWQKDSEKPQYSRWKMTFNNGYIFLVDPRRFATVTIHKTIPSKMRNDLLTGFDEKTFIAQQAVRKINVKILLMEPKALAGIGNIYACEILHQSGVSPLRHASSLSKEEWTKVFNESRSILKRGIEKRGTSISDWRDLFGCPGEYQHELKAYGQENKRCAICGGTICRIKQGGRSTFYCPHCQK
ncbi:MAG: bifunctional DNA-formamidopyrimidine glycosylase/DNA-(apurinic or apyrimidinic site) lyase [Syntrophaceae bacterium]|nr:bifunctional DNA-formamidopyrimidine glycosylase/DNA-(apurinic or apyrimidinic site) lyase [Syntrophaceae bacterium]